MNDSLKLQELDRIVKWRNLIIRINMIMCALLFVIEIGMYFMSFSVDKFGPQDEQYIVKYIVVPISLSLIACFSCYFFEKVFCKTRPAEYLYRYRNIFPVFVSWAILFIISHFHYIFVMTLLLFALPVFMTVFFLERRITTIICVLSCFSIIESVIHSNKVSSNRYILDYMIINITLAILFIIIITALCIILIDLIKNKNMYMEKSMNDARRANKAKTNFLTNMSHEVRTPINAIIGMNELIIRESKEKDTLDCARDIDTAATTLVGLIDEMLDMAVIESGKLEIYPEEYNTEQFIYAVVHYATQRTILKQLAFESNISEDLPSKLYGDDKRILQVISNVVNNAVKYTNEGSVKITIDGYRRNDEFVLQVAVADTGTGISQNNIDHIFDAFEMMDLDGDSNESEAGLGLAISNKLLHMMDSTMSVMSEVGKGSTFSFKISQKIVDDTPIGEFNYSPGNVISSKSSVVNIFAPKAHILIVDDNEVNLKVLKGLLHPSAMQIEEAMSGEQAVKLCRDNHYDLIFLDHLMPGMDGIETMKYIREDIDSLNKLVPTVMLTANATSGAREQFLKEGFDDFLTKPVDTEKLIKVINDLLDPELLESKPDDFIYEEEFTAYDAIILPNIQGINWDRGLENCGTKKLLIDTVNQFCDSIEDDINYLDKNMSFDRDKYRIKVHSIKSVAATVGCDTICVLARILEFAARDGKTDIMDRVHPVLVIEMRKYAKDMEGLAPIVEKDNFGDTNIIALELNNIKSAMIEFDTDRADACMAKINTVFYEDRIQAYVNRLTNAVTNLDADEAIDVCDQLIDILFNDKA